MKSCAENSDDLRRSSCIQSGIRHHPRIPLGRSISTGCGPSSDASLPFVTPPRSPRDWNDTLRDIVQGLEKICGERKGKILETPRPPRVAATEPPRPRRPLSVSLSDSQCRYHGNHALNHGARCLGDRRCPKAIFVRHIETHQELDNKLFQICRHGSLTDVNHRTRTSGDRWRSLPVAGGTIEEFESGEDDVTEENEKQEEISGEEQDQRTSLDQNASRADRDPPTHFRWNSELQELCGSDVSWSDSDESLQIDIGQREPEDLVVALRDRRHLTVEAISGSGNRILHDSILSAKLASGSLLCYLYGNGFLCVMRQPSSKAEEEFVGTGISYIPVVRRNESSLELTVVLHIPDSFKFDDIIVKTVDDRLVVTGRKRPLSLPPEMGDIFEGLDKVLPSFRVLVQLPRGVDARSVCATLTGEQQLVVKGQLDATPRRNTL